MQVIKSTLVETCSVASLQILDPRELYSLTKVFNDSIIVVILTTWFGKQSTNQKSPANSDEDQRTINTVSYILSL